MMAQRSDKLTRKQIFKKMCVDSTLPKKSKYERGNYSLIVNYVGGEQTYLQYVSLAECKRGQEHVLKYGYPTYGGYEIIAPSQIISFRIKEWHG